LRCSCSIAAWVGVRWYSAEYLSALESVPLFGSLNSRQRRAVARSVAREEFAPNRPIVTEGELEDGFFLMDQGTAAVTVAGERKATLGPGAYFGEMAVIDRGPRSATITAEAPVTVLRLPSSARSRFIESDPSIADAIARELRDRLSAGGAAAGDPMSGAVDRNTLVALCRQLRAVQHADWGTEPHKRRRAWFR
jgi:CRP/FNR family cyclic AMP-dependent transcriptional regulator